MWVVEASRLADLMSGQRIERKKPPKAEGVPLEASGGPVGLAS